MVLKEDLDKTVKTAVAIETATNDAIELQGHRNKQTVNKIHMKATTPKRKLSTKQHTLNPVFYVRVRTQLINIAISTLFVVFD